MAVESLVRPRRGTAAAWTSANPILAQGELGYETDTNKLKFGDGSTAWTALPYFGSTGSADKLGLTPTAVKTGAYTAAVGEFVPVDTTGGAVTVTLPAAPADGSVIGVKMVAQGSANAVTVARGGGSDVFNVTGGSTSLSLTALRQDVILQYKASGGIWYVIATDPGAGAGGGEFAFVDPSILAPFPIADLSTASVLGAANRAFQIRARARKTGTLLGFWIYCGTVGTGTEAIDVGIYEPDSGNRDRLFSTGAITLPTSGGNAWKWVGPTGVNAEADGARIGGSAPSVAIVAGQHYDLALSCNSNSPTFGTKPMSATVHQAIPASLMPGVTGAADLCSNPATAHPLPNPLPDGGGTAVGIGIFGVIS